MGWKRNTQVGAARWNDVEEPDIPGRFTQRELKPNRRIKPREDGDLIDAYIRQHGVKKIPEGVTNAKQRKG